MKVVQVLPALEVGGVERGTIDIAKALVEAGHESIVISAGGRLVGQLESEGSRHITWDLGKKSLLTFLKFWSFRKWLRKEKPDIVHVRSRMPAWVVWLAWRGMPKNDRPKFITTLHGMHSVNWYSAIMAKGERVICVSETCKQYLFENYKVDDPDKVTVIHRGIDEDYFYRGFKPSDEWSEKFFGEHPECINKKLICFPGRITRWKGHLELVKVVEELAKQRTDFKVLVVGSDSKGKFLAEVQSAIKTKGLEQFFVFLGTRSDMRELYAISDVSLSLTTTTAESFGRAVVESLAVGSPVVGFSHGAVTETLAAMFPAGLVETNDIDGVVRVIHNTLDEGASIGELFFKLDKMKSATLELYQTLLR
ncbi:glycosyltransferase family 4 protein [Marinobacterium sp. xm-a-152]|uniref:glycosyltransferase family 4 protein n=1 Tax=Marinobacterium sp. xm-a-152 TaxID=2497733 RepID=UPI0019F370EB|nr:2-deoxystreptamine glucosyltransferase [Marinobacterium sp. xm-a-152]